MKTVLIVYHSVTGGTRQMAEAAARGARSEPAIQVNFRRAAEARAEDLLEASGYLFAAPENLAALSGLMKDFFDRTYYAVLDRLNGRPYVALICAGSDGSNAARQLDRIALGWRLKAIAPTRIVCTNAQTPAAILRDKHLSAVDLAACEEIGATLASGVALGIF